MLVLAEMAIPFSMIHLSPLFHFERSLPSNNTIASDGGAVPSPGVMTFGSGQTFPLWYSRGSSAPCTNVARKTIAIAKGEIRQTMVRLRIEGFTGGKVQGGV